jgi:hypothetical protein
MRIRTKIPLVAAIVGLAAVVASVVFTRTFANSIATRGTSHVLYADSVMRSPKAIQAIQVSVQASSSYDGVTGEYTYTYIVTNEASSTGSLETFGIGPVPVTSTLGSPAHWGGGVGWEGDSTLAGWSVSEGDTTPLPPTDTGNDYPSPYDVAPGHSIDGFTIVSNKPPTTISFYAQAFDTIPAGDDDIGPPSLSQEGVTGSILGPDKNAVTAVPENGGRHGVKFRPPTPNPAASSVLLAFELPGISNVTLDVIDVRGSKVRSLIHGSMGGGLHTVTWSGIDGSGHRVPPGVYFHLSVNGGSSERRRVVIVR